jgi:hypothetical protein
MTIVIFLFQFRYRGVDLHLDRSLANGREKIAKNIEFLILKDI